MQRYSMSITDVYRYLATKQSDDIIGICADPSKCLIAEAFLYKYPGVLEVSVTSFEIRVVLNDRDILLPVSPDLETMIEAFDNTELPALPVTKAAFIKEWGAYAEP